MNTKRGLVVKGIVSAVAALLTVTLSAGVADAASHTTSSGVTLRDSNWVK